MAHNVGHNNNQNFYRQCNLISVLPPHTNVPNTVFYIIRSVTVSMAVTIVHTAACHGNSFFDKQPSLWSATTYNAGTRVQLLLLLTLSHHSLPTFGSSFLLQLIDCLSVCPSAVFALEALLEKFIRLLYR